MRNNVQYFENVHNLSIAALNEIINLSKKYVFEKGYFSLVLSGGKTPRNIYHMLAQSPHKEELQIQKMFFFWGDERCTQPDNPESNFGLAYDVFLSHFNLKRDNVVRIFGESPNPESAADDYEKRILFTFNKHMKSDIINDMPSFDLTLLGIGADGHIASLFANTPQLSENKRLVINTEAPPNNPIKDRITLTLPVINNSKHILILVSGAGKSDMLKKVVDTLGKKDPNYPTSMLEPQNTFHIYIDKHSL